MNYHNPENLSEWGQTDGWRLLTTEEIKQPLPDDAGFWASGWNGGEWMRSLHIGEQPNPRNTYRTKKPLPGSPLIAQLDAEIKAKQELKEIVLAVEAGAEWEVYVGKWENPVHSLKYYIDQEVRVRLKPKPVTRPWSKPEDVPLNCWVRNGQYDNCPSQIIGYDTEGFRIIWHNSAPDSRSMFHHVSWERASEAWDYTVTPNDPKSWKPCETTEEAK